MTKKTAKTKTEKKFKVWFRVGTSIQLSEEELRKIVKGNKKFFREKLKEGKPDGEAYLPEETIQDLIDNGLNPVKVFSKGDLEIEDDEAYYVGDEIEFDL